MCVYTGDILLVRLSAYTLHGPLLCIPHEWFCHTRMMALPHALWLMSYIVIHTLLLELHGIKYMYRLVQIQAWSLWVHALAVL